MRLVFLGPPGAGKGTQATVQAEKRALHYIATGDELRKAIAAGTPLGEQAKAYTDSGQLVPDDLIIELFKDLLGKPGSEGGALFDGFPRTLPQAEALDRMLEEGGKTLDAVFYFDVIDEAVVHRLSGRRVCRRCGATYHVVYKAPRQEGVCDKCGGELYQRDDDLPETVRNRLRVYQAQTAALLDYYRDRGLLVRIDAGKAIDDVGQMLDDAIDALGDHSDHTGGPAAGQERL